MPRTKDTGAVERHHPLQHLPGLRAKGEIAPKHQRVRAGAPDLLEHRVQGSQVPVDVIQSI
ncbi:hypothetical protein [Alicyclobacillus acidocaldarius]|uniref:hypothetical protein n=1 Tax=Alicyclobacillus acidocaldarius TaxID=405212 RepID=UPI001ED95E25|nr:hypothetical protein [Alicyclobacillus acidocaldarius]